jgi:hypothetical protein
VCRYADVLAQSLPEMDGASHSAAMKGGATAHAGGSMASAAGSGAAGGVQERLRLPGPAVTVEPSAEAVAAVQALFARQPQLVAEAAEQAHDPSRFECLAFAPEGKAAARSSSSSMLLAAAC